SAVQPVARDTPSSFPAYTNRTSQEASVRLTRVIGPLSPTRLTTLLQSHDMCSRKLVQCAKQMREPLRISKPTGEQNALDHDTATPFALCPHHPALRRDTGRRQGGRPRYKLCSQRHFCGDKPVRGQCHRHPE